MKKWKRILSLLLAICLFTSLLPALSIQAEAAGVKEITRSEVEAKLKDAETTDGFKNGTVNNDKKGSCRECFNFAIKLFQFIFGVKPPTFVANGVFKPKNKNVKEVKVIRNHSYKQVLELLEDCMPGDYIVARGSTYHHMIFRSLADKDGDGVKDTMYVYDGNSDRRNGIRSNNAYNIKKYFTKNKTKSVAVYRYAGYIICEHKEYDEYGLCKNPKCREPNLSKCIITNQQTSVGYYKAVANESAVTVRTTPYNAGSDNVEASLAAGEIAYIHTVKSMRNSYGHLWYEADSYMTKNGTEKKGRFFVYAERLQKMDDPTSAGMILFNITDPGRNKKITAKQSYKLSGTIVSMAGFASIEGKVTDAAGTKTYTSFTVEKPSGTRYSIRGSKLDNKLAFQTIDPGNCILTYTVKDKKGNVQSIEIPFVATTDGWPNLSIKVNSENIAGGKRLTFTAYKNGSAATDAAITVASGEFFEESSKGSCTLEVNSSGSFDVYAEAKKCNAAQLFYSFTVDQTSTPVIGDPVETDMGSEVSITCESDATIYYRVDSGELIQYEKPFVLEQDATVTAYAARPGYTDSEYTSRQIKAAVPRDPVLTAAGTTIAQGGSVTLSWTPTLGAAEYQVWVQRGEEAATQILTTKTAGASVRLETAGTYKVYVTAEAKGQSFKSNELNLTAMADCAVRYFDVNKTVMYTQNVKWGESATPPEVPAVRGYNFTGWSNIAGMARITQDTDFYAQYTPVSYRVRFYGFDGELLKTQYVEYSKAAEAPDPGSCRAGCVFAGWNVSYAKENDSRSDYLYVDSDLDLQAVQIWQNAALPVQITGVTAVYDSKSGTYTVQVQMASSTEAPAAALLRAAIGNQAGQMLRTGSAEYAITPGAEQSVSLTVKYSDPASAVKVYVLGIDTEGRTTGILAEEKQATVTQNAGKAWTAFSEWSTTPAEASATCEVETKTQYAYSTKETTSSSSAALDGWTPAGTSTVEWSGTWSDWSTTAATATDTLKVETKQVAAKTKTQYHYVRYVGTYNGNKSYSHFCPNNKYIDKSTQKDQSVWIDKSLSRITSWGTQCCRCHGDYHKFSYNSKTYYGKAGGETRQVVVTPAHTEYRTQSGVKYYDFYRWGVWSEWQDTPVQESGTVSVRTQTLYRYRTETDVAEAITDEKQVSGQKTQTVTGNLAVDTDLNGRCAAVLVYNVKNTDPNESQIQYVGQTKIGADNSYSFSFIPSENPSIDTGDFVVSLAVEGASGLVNVATIEAPRQMYHVSFLGLNQTDLGTIDVPEGGSVEYPEAPEAAGYRFAGWSAPVTSISRDITISARYLPEEYAVVLADHINQTVNLQRVSAISEDGAPAVLTLPADLTAEGYTFKGWMQDGTLVEGGSITVTKDTVLEASWEPVMFTVEFLNEKGEVISTQQVAYGQSATPPAPITAEGMTFLGWSTDECWWNVKMDLNIKTVTETVTKDETQAQELVTREDNHAVAPLMAYVWNAETPVSSLGPAAAGTEKVLELTTEEDGTKIYYTIDGSDPSPDKVCDEGGEATDSRTLVYDGPLTLTEDTDIKAIGVKDGRNDSEIMEFTFYYSEEDADGELEGRSVVIAESDIMAKPGATIPMSVRIANNPGLMAYVMLVECDRQVFYVDRLETSEGSYDCTAGAAFEKGSLLVAPCEEGYQIFWYSTAQTTDDDTLFTLRLKVNEEADSATRKIRLSYYPDNTVTGDLSAAVLDNALDVSFGEETSVLGDVNQDGRITAADVVLIARYVINDVTFTSAQVGLADVTGDDKINSADVIRLARYIVGLAALG